MTNEAGDLWVVFNGEIYNHLEICRRLQNRGRRYRTRSDTETILHAYEEWGDACVDHLRGMFAFAIWDAGRRRLLAARDRLGIKPLYWTLVGGRLLFASEIKALLASDLIVAELNQEALPELLGTRSLSGTRTMFRGIHKLLPGHQLVFERGAIRIRQYWDVPHRAASDRGDARNKSDRDVVDEFRSALDASVRLHLMSDVPLGVFLSGGIDSSAIAALMARAMNRPVQTFSVAFKERAFNELGYARDVARAIGADSHEVTIDDRDFFDALPRLIWQEDEPIAHPSSVPLYYVSALARRFVKVVLTGEGSDELLAGYGKYLRSTWNWRAGALYERLVPRSLRASIARSVAVLPRRVACYARRSFLTVERTPQAMFFDNFAAVRLADQRDLLASRRRDDDCDAYAVAVDYFSRLDPRTTLLDRLLYTDLKTYLVELLMKQDQMSMAASIESRVPFLDHVLVELSAGLPDRWKLSGWTTKRVLRHAMKGLLPASILNRPKMGFPVPFSRWTREGWNSVARETLLDRRSRERGIIDSLALTRLLDDHAAGRTDGGDRIWSLLNLELWHRTFIDGGGVQTLPAITGRHAHPVAEIGSAAAAR